MHRCPCCGHELQCPGILWLPVAGLLLRSSDQLVAQFTGRETPLFDALWQPYIAGAKRFTPFRTLVDAVYGDEPNGGPHSAELCIYQYVHKIKAKLKPFGLMLYVRDHAVILCQREVPNVLARHQQSTADRSLDART